MNNNLIGKNIDRYTILEPLGEGGMATVYKAYDTRLECDVAIKFIRTERLTAETSSRALKRFRTEANKMAQLTHPNIIGVTDYGEYDGTPYLVMRYLPGGTLKQKITGPIPYQEAARFLAPIARALEFAHSQGIVHRDIKPANILLTASGQPMLSDFGIAKILITDETQDFTTTGVGVGTPEYMAPEQAMGQTVDARADVYALGIVLYEMVTGRKPFRADTPMAVIIKQVHDPLPLPREYVHDLPEPVEQVIIKALAKKPEDRYQDMGAFAVALEKLAANNFSIQKKKALGEPKQTQAAPGTTNRKPFPWKWGAISLGVVVLVFAGLWVGLPRLFHPSPSATVGQPSLTPSSGLRETQNPQKAGDESQPVVSMTPTLATSEPTTTETDAIKPTPSNEKLVFSENFEDGFANGFEFDKGNWSVVDDGTGNKVLEQNMFRDPTGLSFGPKIFTDGVIEFRFRDISENPQSYPVVLTLRHQDSGTQYIVGYLVSDGTTCLCYSENNSEWQSMEAYSGNVKVFPYSNKAWVTLRAIAIGKQIQVFLNGDLIASASDSRLSQGNLTLGTGQNIAVQFDDIKITEIKSPKTNATETLSSANEPGWKAGGILFLDDFENGNLNKWKVNGFWKIVKDEIGNSVLQREGSETVNVEAGSTSWKNYMLTLRAKVLKYGGGTYHQSFCLGFRSNCQGDCPEYSWNFHQNFQNLGGPGPGNSWEQFMVSDYSLPLNQWLNLRVEVTDNILRGFVNDEQFFEATDQTSPLLSGNIRLVTDGEAKVWFDDVKVIELKPTNP